MSDDKKKYGRMNIYMDPEAQAAYDWLREQDMNVSAMVKRILKDKVAEMQGKKESK